MITARSLAARALGAVAATALAVAGLVAVAVAPAAATPADTVVYDSVPATLASSYPSLGYQATSTDEFGDYVVLGGTQRELTTATVGLVSWTCGNWESGSSPCTTTPGDTYSHPITLNIYAADTSGAVPAAGALLTSVTQNQAIPYRPSASAECTGGNAGKWWDGAACNSGYAFSLTFDLGGVVVPNDVIVTIAYNTQTHGAAPVGTTGPYNSLNVALAPAAPTVGADETEDEVFWDTSVAGFYADGGAGGTDSLRVDTDWSGYHGLILRLAATSPVTNVECSAITTASAATDLNLDGWDFSQTRANGSNTFVPGGLKVATTVGDSLAKAAGYKAIDIALAEVGDLAIDLTDTTGVPPSVQLGTDLDNNGTQDGYLVYEPNYYGENLWASNGIVSGGFTGLPTVGGGGGPISGTIDQYLAAYPDARVLSFGYSLGSGVIGSAVITSITVGCTEYPFTKAPTVNVTCSATADGGVATDAALDGWDLSQTRANGSNTFVADGLKVTTTVGDSLAKAAGYKTIDLALAEVGQLDIDLSDVSGVPPSVQLVVDLDDNGSTDGILVYEPDFYGENLWATNSIVSGGFVGLPTVGGGGSSVSGTINQYLAAYPEARVVAFGYSLGSGVIGSAVIHSITVGCAEYGFAKEPVVNITCPAIGNGGHATELDLDGWSFAQTRANGSNTFVPGGLKVVTTVGDSLAKAAGYKDIDIALAEVGDIAIDLTNVTGVPPSLQLGVDLDNDGTQDGYLVYEPSFYGENLWASGQITGHVPAFVGLPTEPGGGSGVSGTIDQYLAAYPEARVLSFGYSLGSGVIGSAVITGITVGCDEYTFAQSPVVNVTCPVIDEGPVATNAALDGWDFSQTRANGSNTFVDGGLKVVTTVGDSLAKAAGYKPIDLDLSQVGQLDIDLSDVSGVPPSVQLVVDLDDNGSTDGILVYEPDFYGENLWATNSIVSGGFVGLPTVGGGGGPVSGTINQYLAAYPDAHVVAFGYSLGSGVIGSAVIHSITVGCDEYGFDGVVVPGTPTISGTPSMGQTLTALPGTWAPAGVTFEYQWRANGSPIASGTTENLLITADLVGATLDVVVTGTASGIGSASATSGSVVVAAGVLTTAQPVIVGEASIGSTLTADPGTWGPAPVTLTYQWLRDGSPIDGATDSTYLLTFADAGNAVSVRVTGTKLGYTSASRTSNPTISLPTDAIPAIERLSGPSRYETAVAISAGWAPGVDRVYVATGENYPDALSAAAAAAHFDAPVLLTKPGSVPAAVLTELERLAPDTIVIVGSTAAVADAVRIQLEALPSNPDVVRIGGVDRFETSRLIASDAFLSGGATTAYVATGHNFPDALSAAPAAASVDGPVVLVPGLAGSVDAATLDLLDDLGVDTVKIVGSTMVVSAGVASSLSGFTVVRLEGANRYGTAVAVNLDAFDTAPTVYLATGENFPDALAGAARAGYEGRPLFISQQQCIPTAIMDAITTLNPGRIVLLGGEPALSTRVEDLETC